MIEMLNNRQPVMMFVDMGFLPCFDFGEGYYFGGHTHVVCGYDGEKTVLVSEMEPKAPTSMRRAEDIYQKTPNGKYLNSNFNIGVLR